MEAAKHSARSLSDRGFTGVRAVSWSVWRVAIHGPTEDPLSGTPPSWKGKARGHCDGGHVWRLSSPLCHRRQRGCHHSPERNRRSPRRRVLEPCAWSANFWTRV